ncbi:MBL fold metallo-hydrolase [Bacillus haimaensis]
MVDLLFKKKASSGEVNGVSYLNGEISLKGVSLNVYSYLIDGMLIDTGAHSLHKFFEPFLDEADFDQVMLTHFHEDHTGCAAYVQKTKNVPVYLNEISIASCLMRADYPLYRQLFWGRRKPFQAQPVSGSFQSRSATWDAIDTPGHAYDHKAFLNRETGQLFTGDLFVSARTKLALADESTPEIIRSLERILSYDFLEVFCSHAGYLEDGRKAIERKRDYLLSIQAEVLSLYKDGYSAEEIRRKLFPKTFPIVKFSRGEWDSIHIVTSILREHSLQPHK